MSSASYKAGEPSMEDILASIRRIISDDQEAIRAPAPEETASSPLKNVLDIAERHAAPVHSSPVVFHQAQEDEAREAPFQDDIVRNVISNIVGVYGKDGPVAEAPPVRPPARPAAGPEREEPLLSSEADASVADAFGRLNAILLPREPRTVEDLMKEMLRPMLKAWLDDNLPAMVERLVQAEIRRVTRG